jgi:putative tryptophan/tyrosine transport system substrate-binding protein
MRRRDFIAGLGGVVAWPLVARAQKRTMPVIGVLANAPNLLGASFYQGLKEAGYVEGQNIAVEYRVGPSNVNRLSELATELVQQQVALIVTFTDGAALGAKRATSTIPIIFSSIGSDPVTLGLVASLNRPGGNVTGATFDSPHLLAKRLDLLCQLVPTAGTVAYLARSRTLLSFEKQKNSLAAAAGALGRQLTVVECPRDDELGNAFATVVERGAGAVVVGPLIGINVVPFAAQYRIPAAYGRGFALRGGLMSYGRDPADEMRIVASLVGQILDGAIPANLPVRRSSKFKFVINLKTAKELGLDVPLHLLVGADEVIE